MEETRERGQSLNEDAQNMSEKIKKMREELPGHAEN